jgi:hypothetical protein
MKTKVLSSYAGDRRPDTVPEPGARRPPAQPRPTQGRQLAPRSRESRGLRPDLCSPEYLARGSKNPQAIINLAGLVATRQRLDAGYQRVIWMDADMFMFDPAKLVFDFPAECLTTGYAFGSLPRS